MSLVTHSTTELITSGWSGLETYHSARPLRPEGTTSLPSKQFAGAAPAASRLSAAKYAPVPYLEGESVDLLRHGRDGVHRPPPRRAAAGPRGRHPRARAGGLAGQARPLGGRAAGQARDRRSHQAAPRLGRGGPVGAEGRGRALLP